MTASPKLVSAAILCLITYSISEGIAHAAPENRANAGMAMISGTMPATVPATGPVAGPVGSYADVADFAAESTTIIDARIRRVRPVESARAVGLAPGMARFYIEAQTNTVIFGRDPLARRFAYLLDVPLGPDGRAPRVPKQRVLLFAGPVTVTNQLVLVTTTAQLGWTAERDATARAIATELSRAPAPPRVTGISQAFHAPGSIPGESETQIFLRTADSTPVSLSILRRPGQAVFWSVAFGEIVDESTGAPPRRTLGWFRLACGLPERLPADALANAAPEDARMIMRDYAVVTSSVGACDRTGPAPVMPAAR